MITKPLSKMDLDELNQAIAEAGGGKVQTRLDHARSALKKLVKAGTAQVAEGVEFEPGDKKKAKEAAKAAAKKEKEAAKAAKAAEKKVKTEKPKKKVEWDRKHERVGGNAFTRHGRGKIAAIGTLEGDKEPTRALVKVGEEQFDISLASCRSKAVNEEYRDRYPVDKANKTPSGKPSIGVEDDITEKLKGADTAVLSSVAAENDIDFSRWEHCNPGMKRMCLGNVLRGRARQGGRVVISGEVIVEGAEAAA